MGAGWRRGVGGRGREEEQAMGDSAMTIAVNSNVIYQLLIEQVEECNWHCLEWLDKFKLWAVLSSMQHLCLARVSPS